MDTASRGQTRAVRHRLQSLGPCPDPGGSTENTVLRMGPAAGSPGSQVQGLPVHSAPLCPSSRGCSQRAPRAPSISPRSEQGLSCDSPA